MVICPERDEYDLHMVQLMPLLPQMQIVSTFLVPAYPGCPRKEAIKWGLS